MHACTDSSVCQVFRYPVSHGKINIHLKLKLKQQSRTKVSWNVHNVVLLGLFVEVGALWAFNQCCFVARLRERW